MPPTLEATETQTQTPAGRSAATAAPITPASVEHARELATASHAAAREALAGAAPAGAPELEQITDFIYTRTS